MSTVDLNLNWVCWCCCFWNCSVNFFRYCIFSTRLRGGYGNVKLKIEIKLKFFEFNVVFETSMEFEIKLWFVCKIFVASVAIVVEINFEASAESAVDVFSVLTDIIFIWCIAFMTDLFVSLVLTIWISVRSEKLCFKIKTDFVTNLRRIFKCDEICFCSIAFFWIIRFVFEFSVNFRSFFFIFFHKFSLFFAELNFDSIIKNRWSLFSFKRRTRRNVFMIERFFFNKNDFVWDRFRDSIRTIFDLESVFWADWNGSEMTDELINEFDLDSVFWTDWNELEMISELINEFETNDVVDLKKLFVSNDEFLFWCWTEALVNSDILIIRVFISFCLIVNFIINCWVFFELNSNFCWRFDFTNDFRSEESEAELTIEFVVDDIFVDCLLIDELKFIEFVDSRFRCIWTINIIIAIIKSETH